MKKIILIGKSGSGKTTLIQSINRTNKIYIKTQTLEYYDSIVDTPGEYIENKRFYNALIVSSFECDLIGLVQDSKSRECIFPPGFASMFNIPAIGIITKIDKGIKDEEYTKACLRSAGAVEVFKVSAIMDRGIDLLREYLRGK